tara:strand:+ start:2522 stop:2743 length:222 start_codon:yes stop_codon:yes gene_type:complete
MFRLFDILLLTAATLAFGLAGYLFVYSDQMTALFVGLWVPIILGFGIHIKLVRIVHFVLYKNFKLNENGEENG